jgi:hypothetical protein
MRLIIAVALLGLIGAGAITAPARANGCLKGAAVGGVAGHMAGHHGVLGAAAGCAVGHHEASEKERTQQVQNNDDAGSSQRR